MSKSAIGVFRFHYPLKNECLFSLIVDSELVVRFVACLNAMCGGGSCIVKKGLCKGQFSVSTIGYSDTVAWKKMCSCNRKILKKVKNHNKRLNYLSNTSTNHQNSIRVDLTIFVGMEKKRLYQLTRLLLEFSYNC